MSKVSLQCRVFKLDDELRLAKGPVLRPDIRDRHGTTVDRTTIRQAAHQFMIRYRLGETTSGYMHRDFYRADERFQIVECYITDVDVTIPRTERLAIDGEDGDGDIVIPAGSWMMAVVVKDDQVWEQIKSGVVKGFSIGGTADIVPDEEMAA